MALEWQKAEESIFCVLVLKRNSVCMRKKIADIFFYMTDIPNSTYTLTGSNLIKGVLENIYWVIAKICLNGLDWI